MSRQQKPGPPQEPMQKPRTACSRAKHRIVRDAVDDVCDCVDTFKLNQEQYNLICDRLEKLADDMEQYVIGSIGGRTSASAVDAEGTPEADNAG